MASLASYAACQSVCSGIWVSCYATAGLVAGTVTAGVGAPAAALACNAACGTCMSVCASRFLAEGAAETAASGGVLGPVTFIGGAVVAASGYFGRGFLARFVAPKIAGAGASAGASTGATVASASTGGAAVASTGGATVTGATAATSMLPIAMMAATMVTVGVASYQAYQWWNRPQFPTGIQVRILDSEHVGRTGTVVGIAVGNIAVDLGDRAGLLQISPDSLSVIANGEDLLDESSEDQVVRSAPRRQQDFI